MRGLRLLRERGIPFHVISVITREALGHAEEIYDFFESEGVERLGLNIEEVEANNMSSTLAAREDARVREFYEVMFQRQKERRTITIREFDAARQKVLGGVSRCGTLTFRGSTNRRARLAS